MDILVLLGISIVTLIFGAGLFFLLNCLQNKRNNTIGEYYGDPMIAATVISIIVMIFVIFAGRTTTEVACELTYSGTEIAYIDERGAAILIDSQDLKTAKIVDCDHSYCGVITEEFLGIEMSKHVQIYTPIVWKEEE